MPQLNVAFSFDRTYSDRTFLIEKWNSDTLVIAGNLEMLDHSEDLEKDFQILGNLRKSLGILLHGWKPVEGKVETEVKT